MKPNDFGLFDMQGNVYEWCYNTITYLSVQMGAVGDSPSTEGVDPTVGRVLRGGAFFVQSVRIRSASRIEIRPPGYRADHNGFRPARTYHLSP